MIKKTIKTILSKLGRYIPFISKMEYSDAENILQQYSPKPKGRIYSKNKVDIKYNLQIIIPVYNREKYIKDCVDSVLSQKASYKILISIVDDGSTDRTHEIISNISNLNLINSGKIIEIISQNNTGYSGARNAALKEIKGDYVLFLDSDDLLADNAVKNMLDAAYLWDADILQGGVAYFDEQNRIEDTASRNGIWIDNYEVFSGLVCGKLYKHKVLENFRFPEGYWFEDTPISFIIAAMPFRFATIKDIVYNYRINPEGISAVSVNSKKSVDSYWITEECLKEFPVFNLKYDQRAYEYVLRQSIMNEMRSRKRPARIREAEFILTNKILENYFKNNQTQNFQMRAIEKALRKKQFIKFELLTLNK